MKEPIIEDSRHLCNLLAFSLNESLMFHTNSSITEAFLSFITEDTFDKAEIVSQQKAEVFNVRYSSRGVHQFELLADSVSHKSSVAIKKEVILNLFDEFQKLDVSSRSICCVILCLQLLLRISGDSVEALEFLSLNLYNCFHSESNNKFSDNLDEIVGGSEYQCHVLSYFKSVISLRLCWLDTHKIKREEIENIKFIIFSRGFTVGVRLVNIYCGIYDNLKTKKMKEEMQLSSILQIAEILNESISILCNADNNTTIVSSRTLEGTEGEFIFHKQATLQKLQVLVLDLLKSGGGSHHNSETTMEIITCLITLLISQDPLSINPQNLVSTFIELFNFIDQLDIQSEKNHQQKHHGFEQWNISKIQRQGFKFTVYLIQSLVKRLVDIEQFDSYLACNLLQIILLKLNFEKLNKFEIQIVLNSLGILVTSKVSLGIEGVEFDFLDLYSKILKSYFPLLAKMGLIKELLLKYFRVACQFYRRCVGCQKLESVCFRVVGVAKEIVEELTAIKIISKRKRILISDPSYTLFLEIKSGLEEQDANFCKMVLI